MRILSSDGHEETTGPFFVASVVAHSLSSDMILM
jgi:hypothetical protein